MLDNKTLDILKELKRKILSKYKLKKMRIFGSKARGENGPDSDIDVFLLISDQSRTFEEDIFDLAYETELEQNCLIDIFVFDDKTLKDIHFWAPVYQEILKEGLII